MRAVLAEDPFKRIQAVGPQALVKAQPRMRPAFSNA
jgi:hypothetical protein